MEVPELLRTEGLEDQQFFVQGLRRFFIPIRHELEEF